MKLSLLVFVSSSLVATAFVPSAKKASTFAKSTTRVNGYLDDLSKELYSERDEPDVESETKEATKLDQESVDRYGVGEWDQFVDFEEFDGGDGQMGVAGDGKKGLEKEWQGEAQMAKSKMRSAKNAWGTFTGYADELIEKGVEQSRAQQLENWQNQQEVLAHRKQQRFMTDEFDQVKKGKDEDWRSLAKFGVERNQEFDLDEAFGAVVPGTEFEGVIELESRLNQNKPYEFKLKNNFMGFSDFRASFAPETNGVWTVEPKDGSLSGKKDTDFLVKFRPSSPGVSEAYLVIDTEDDKWTWKCIGNASM